MRTLTRPGRRPRKAQARRGAALLIALAATVVAAGAALVAAQAAAARLAQARLDMDSRRAMDLARAAEARVVAWLGEESASVVLPPSADVPAVAVVDDSWSEADGASRSVEARVLATAFDQRGMVPWGIAASGGRWRALLPPDVRRAVADAESAAGRASGPSSERAARGIDEIAPLPGRGRFPRALAGGDGARRFGEDGGSADAAGRPAERGAAAVGALVATHAEGAFAINPNTAPIALLEEVGRIEQRDLAGPAREARSRGLPAPPMPASPPSRSAGPDGEGTDDMAEAVAVGSSDLWSVRIDATFGRARSSWWLVFRRGGDGWELAQRLGIPE